MAEPPKARPERDASTDGRRPRVLVVVGTRPEVVKMAPVVQALRDRPEVQTVLALSGQHADLVEQTLQVFALDLDQELEVARDLALMRPGQDLYDLAGGMLEGFRGMLQELGPDLVLVQGDTATVFFGALASFFERIPVGHVEAGLRSGDKWSPFPEEIFRRLTDVSADLLFAPTPEAARNLRAEGAPEERIAITGNTVVDAVRAAAGGDREPRNETLRRILENEERKLVLLTAHRRESFGAPLRELFGAVRELADRTRGVDFLYPVHPNPNVLEPAREVLGDHPAVHLVEPLDYVDLVLALRSARLVLTDSGGIQEEAPAFGAPVLVLRDTTERPEGVAAGVARLVGTSRERILAEALPLIENDAAHARMSRRANPYGDGRAGERIADVVVSKLTGVDRRTDDWEPASEPSADPSRRNPAERESRDRRHPNPASSPPSRTAFSLR